MLLSGPESPTTLNFLPDVHIVVLRRGQIVAHIEDVWARLRAQGVRVEVDTSDERFPKKIRTASKEKIPFTLIAGGDDADANAVSFRYRDGSQDNQVPVDEAVRRIVEAVRTKAQV